MRVAEEIPDVKTLIGLCMVGLSCWVVMFLAGTDVWHFIGSPDFWRLSEPPNADLRVFAYAFYLQLVVLLGGMGIAMWHVVKANRQNSKN